MSNVIRGKFPLDEMPIEYVFSIGLRNAQKLWTPFSFEHILKAYMNGRNVNIGFLNAMKAYSVEVTGNEDALKDFIYFTYGYEGRSYNAKKAI